MSTCQLCSGSEYRLLSTRLREGEGRIVQCAGCGLIIQDLDWDAERLKRYYEEEYQDTNSLVTGQAQTPREHFNDRLQTLAPILEKLAPLLAPGQDILELGCGCGALLHSLGANPGRRVGLEMHSPFVEFMRQDLGLEAHTQGLGELGFAEDFDLAICIDSLDHMPDPLVQLRLLWRALRPGGVLYLEVPNEEDALGRNLPEQTRQAYKTFFWHRAHLFYFSRSTLGAMLAAAGFGADITCRHNYTLKNHLSWYFTGRPQGSFVAGTTKVELYPGKDAFEQGMNALMRDMEPRFKALLAETFTGDALCCVAHKPGQGA